METEQWATVACFVPVVLGFLIFAIRKVLSKPPAALPAEPPRAPPSEAAKAPIEQRTKRNPRQCPNCESRRFLVLKEFRTQDHEAGNLDAPFPVLCFQNQQRPFFGERKAFGHFETWVCAGCGFTEWYAVGFETIEERCLADSVGSQVVLVDLGAQQGPFR